MVELNVPLEFEGAKLLLCKVAVKHLLTPRGQNMTLGNKWHWLYFR